MEYCEGENLKAFIERRKKADRKENYEIYS